MKFLKNHGWEIMEVSGIGQDFSGLGFITALELVEDETVASSPLLPSKPGSLYPWQPIYIPFSRHDKILVVSSSWKRMQKHHPKDRGLCDAHTQGQKSAVDSF